MIRFLSLLFVFTLLTFPAFADKPVIKIGASLPLTGDNAHLGESARDAMILAKENLPADTKFDYQLVFEDDAMEAKKAALSANKLINIDKVDALLSFSSGTGGVISPIAEKNKKIHFGIASAQNVADGDYNFLHNTTPAEECRVMAAELQKRGYKKVALILFNHPFPLEQQKNLQEKLTGTGIEIVAAEIANPGEKDFRTIIGKVKEKNPDIYLVLFFSPELEILVKQMKEANITAPVTSIEAFGLSNQIGLYEGQWYVDAAAPEKEFDEKFTERFNKGPQMFAANAYDIFNLIVYGYEHSPESGKHDNAAAANTLMHLKDFDGMLGNLSIDEKGVVFSPAAVKIIKNGKPVVESAISSIEAREKPEDVEPAGAN
jgi:branched-chain amino acid transport system substrate-binding protein